MRWQRWRDEDAQRWTRETIDLHRGNGGGRQTGRWRRCRAPARTARPTRARVPFWRRRRPLPFRQNGRSHPLRTTIAFPPYGRPPCPGRGRRETFQRYDVELEANGPNGIRRPRRPVVPVVGVAATRLKLLISVSFFPLSLNEHPHNNGGFGSKTVCTKKRR